MEEKQFKKNQLGLLGWLGGGRYGIERYAYTLHRITGLGILAYFLMHIFVTATRAFGQQAWESTMGYFDKPLFRIGEYLVFAAFAYHGLNGIRLVLTELGFFLGRPQQPIYPYVTSVSRQRPLFVIVMLLATVFVVVGGYDFFFVAK